jgi:restriction system protein
MARKRKANPLINMLDLVSLLPWWAGVAIAIVSYVVLHLLAAPVKVTGVRPEQVGQHMTQAIISGLATVGQFVVPIACLVAAAMSFLRRRHRVSLITDVARAQSATALVKMPWREFEMLVGEAYRLQGYRVTETGGGGADEGIDLAMTKDGEIFLVQCKQWKAYKVGVSVVRELYGVMAAKGATGGFVVTSGRFTREAKAFAEGRNVQLVDGPALFSMIAQAKQSLVATSQQVSGKPQMTPSIPIELTCPRCGSGMVKRIARRGGNAGGGFWGCERFPTCRGVRSLSCNK